MTHAPLKANATASLLTHAPMCFMQNFMRRMLVVGQDCNLIVPISPSLNEMSLIQMLAKMCLERVIKNLDSQLQHIGRKKVH